MGERRKQRRGVKYKNGLLLAVDLKPLNNNNNKNETKQLNCGGCLMTASFPHNYYDFIVVGSISSNDNICMILFITCMRNLWLSLYLCICLAMKWAIMFNSIVIMHHIHRNEHVKV